MGTQYSQITIEERCEMACLRTAGHPIRQFAASLDRSPSTVSRELDRNASRTQSYLPAYADLRDRVLSRLQQGRSPEQVAGRLALESGKKVISHETIYRFIYAHLARKKDYSWRHYLPRPSRNGGGGDARGQSGLLNPSAPTAGGASKGGL